MIRALLSGALLGVLSLGAWTFFSTLFLRSPTTLEQAKKVDALIRTRPLDLDRVVLELKRKNSTPQTAQPPDLVLPDLRDLPNPVRQKIERLSRNTPLPEIRTALEELALELKGVSNPSEIALWAHHELRDPELSPTLARLLIRALERPHDLSGNPQVEETLSQMMDALIEHERDPQLFNRLLTQLEAAQTDPKAAAYLKRFKKPLPGSP